MGDMAEYYLEQDAMFGNDFYGLPEADFVWVSKDGTRWNLCDMSKRHLKNTITMLKRQIEDREFVVDLMEDELENRL